jgi:hypothetical protein
VSEEPDRLQNSVRSGAPAQSALVGMQRQFSR